jgi:hypothetical protein
VVQLSEFTDVHAASSLLCRQMGDNLLAVVLPQSAAGCRGFGSPSRPRQRPSRSTRVFPLKTQPRVACPSSPRRRPRLTTWAARRSRRGPCSRPSSRRRTLRSHTSRQVRVGGDGLVPRLCH